MSYDVLVMCLVLTLSMFSSLTNAAGIYLLKVNNKNTRHHSGVIIVNFERISYLVLVFLLLTVNV